jgi:uncharacterized protein (DUF302 family)
VPVLSRLQAGCRPVAGLFPDSRDDKFMSYYFSKVVNDTFDDAVERVTARLAEAGFGVLTTIDVSATLKKKIDVDMPRYTILGACNPGFAHKALQAENKIGTMLPCNVVVQETADGQVEVAAVDPVASMASIENASLGEIAQQVQGMLKDVIEGL